MRGKDKCRILKQIRKQIAEENDIPYVVEECKHKGECKGTCPKCEADLKMLERELSLRYRLGKTVAIAGIAAGMMTMTTGCGIEDAVDLLHDLVGIEARGGNEIEGVLPNPKYPIEGEAMPLSGDVEYYPEDDDLTGLTVPDNWDDQCLDGRQTEGEIMPPEYHE